MRDAQYKYYVCSVVQHHFCLAIVDRVSYGNAMILCPFDISRASKSPDYAGDLPIFDKIMKISRSPDLE